MTTMEDDFQTAMEMAGDAARKRRSCDFRRRAVKQCGEDKTVQTEVTHDNQPSPIIKIMPLMNLTHAGSVAFVLVTGTLSQLKLLVTSGGSHGFYFLFVGLLIISLMFHLCVAVILILITKREVVVKSDYRDDIEKLNLFRIMVMLIACVSLINICIFVLA